MKIEIPNPCSEDFNKMNPVTGGSFCNSCQEKVYDFTKKGAVEIKQFFLEKEAEEKVCAKMSQQQLLQMNFDAFFSKFRLWNFWRRAAVVVYFIFGLGLFSCGNGDEHVVGKMQVNDTLQPRKKDSLGVQTTETGSLQEDSLVATQNETRKGNEKKDSTRHFVGKVKIENEQTSEQDLKQDPKNHPPPLPLAPTYKDGKEQMDKIIKANLKYPEEARKNKIEGTVLVMFKITAEGKMKDIKLKNKLGYGCDEEALRVVKLLKDWNPGKQGGKAIGMDFGVAVEFKL